MKILYFFFLFFFTGFTLAQSPNSFRDQAVVKDVYGSALSIDEFGNIGVNSAKVITSENNTEIDMNLYEFTGNELLNAIIHGEEQHFASITLPNNQTSVFQGFVFDNKSKFLYVSNKSGGSGSSERSMITKYEFDGDGHPDEVSHSDDLYVGHAQDLSIEYFDESTTYLWTSSANGRGATRINYDGSNSSIDHIFTLLPRGYRSSTPTVSTNGRYLVIRGLKNSINTVFVYKINEVLSGLTTPIAKWNVDSDQYNKTNVNYFQGILCDNDIVYCLSGYSQTSGVKKLYAYTLNGDLLFKKDIVTGKSWASGRGNKWEPEGLSIYHPHPNVKTLLVGICAKDNSSGSNTDDDAKRIYIIGLWNGMWSIDGDFHPHDIGLYFGGGSRDITYKSTHSLQFGRWNPNDLTYLETMRLNNNGEVLIGTSSSNNKKLYVNGSSGGTTSWNSSDLRYKKSILPIDNALKKVVSLRGVSYMWKDGDLKESKDFDNKRHYGVIAQDIEKEFPELIDHPGQNQMFKHVEYNGFAGIFIEAIKEQQLIIDSLTNDLNKLRDEFEQLKRVVIVKE